MRTASSVVVPFSGTQLVVCQPSADALRQVGLLRRSSRVIRLQFSLGLLNSQDAVQSIRGSATTAKICNRLGWDERCIGASQSILSIPSPTQGGYAHSCTQNSSCRLCATFSAGPVLFYGRMAVHESKLRSSFLNKTGRANKVWLCSPPLSLVAVRVAGAARDWTPFSLEV